MSEKYSEPIELRTGDPFAALVDFMAFMVLISIFLFIISDDGVPHDAGSKANVVSVRVTSKSATTFTQELRISETGEPPWADVEYTLWVVEENGKPQIGEEVLDQVVSRNVLNESTIFGVAPEKASASYIISVSHLNRLELVGTFMELAIDVQIGKKACSVNWPGRLGIDPGVLIDLDSCKTG